MPVSITLRDIAYEVRAGMTARDALKKIDIPPESVLITRNGELITEDEILKEGEQIRLIAVISGGSDRKTPGQVGKDP
jgi:sulfur carrier protein ThiS